MAPITLFGVKDEMTNAKLTYGSTLEIVLWMEQKIPKKYQKDWKENIDDFKELWNKAKQAAENGDEDADDLGEEMVHDFHALAECFLLTGLYDSNHVESAIELFRQIHGSSVSKPKLKVFTGGKRK